MAVYDDSHLPEWQRWLNTFCENWIFAFLVAMAIRHFCLEAFRIPTSSMEPMLFGDVGMAGDQVVVDKLAWRFTGTHRWDVTVFQYPRPELESPTGDALTAVDSTGKRLDKPLVRPLFGRNFVKRCLVLPGDTYYFAGGDLHVKEGDRFVIPQKPERVQDDLWLTVYRAGDAPGYLPWSATGGASAEVQGTTLSYRGAGSASAAAAFTQPLRNLWIKPGPAKVAAMNPAYFRILSQGPGKEQEADDAVGMEQIRISLTAPQFQWRGQTGSIWDLDSWLVKRLTVRDLDSHQHGALVNPIMNEYVRDVRIVGTVSQLDGTVELQLVQGTAHAAMVTLDGAGWKLTVDGTVVVQGTGSLVGHAISFGHLDGAIGLWIDGVRRADVPVAEVDPQVQRTRLTITGAGTLTLSGTELQRDLHYSVRGFLEDETAALRERERTLNAAVGDPRSSVTEINTDADNLRMISDVRAQLLGKQPDQLSTRERSAPLATSPATAVTAPEGCYLMLGDNSPFSLDGRMWGYVPEENLRGRALAVLFPPSRWRVIR